jgi:lipid-A-disaccharide synthase
MNPRPLTIAIVAGEESGDALGADLLRALRGLHGGNVSVMGVGGQKMQAEGLATLFDPHEIALMGISAVLKKLPRLMLLIGKTASAILAAKPDCLIIIDSPDFTHRVARKVRARDPSIPILNYVCPSVWAWRPGRARAMRAYVDEVLAILPFEVETLKRLEGPPATYVGHPLGKNPLFERAAAAQRSSELDRFSDWSRPAQLLCLPGSRRGQIERHLESIGCILLELKNRGCRAEVTVPTFERFASYVSGICAKWAFPVRVVHGQEEKEAAFSAADAAIAASGTVTLELALSGVPMVSIYRFDLLARPFRNRVKIWSWSLPNLIADQPVVPEYVDQMIRPGLLARKIEELTRPGPQRDAQLQGFDLIRERMQTDAPAGTVCAERVMWWIERKRSISAG